MRILASLSVLLLTASVASAGPIASVAQDSTLGGLNRFSFSLNPDGETNYTAVEVSIGAGTGQFSEPRGNASFNPVEEGSAVDGLTTVAGGYTVVGIEATPNDLNFTLTSFGGPPTATFNGRLAQVTGPADLAGQAQFRFADGSGAIIDDFTQIIQFGQVMLEPEAVGDPPSGSNINMQPVFNDGTGVWEDAIMVMDANDTGDLMIGEPSFSQNDEGLFGIVPGTAPGKFTLTLDVDAALNGPIRDVGAALTIPTNGGDLQYTLSARVPEPATFGLAGLALVGLVGLRRRG